MGQFVIGGDDELEEQLGLPDEIRAVKIGNEILEQYDPYQVHYLNSVAVFTILSTQYLVDVTSGV